MRSIVLAGILLIAAATAAMGQSMPNTTFVSGDAGVTYHWVRTNTQPAACGCFNLNGGGVSGSWNIWPRLAAVAEIGVEHTGNGPSGNSLTLTSYLAGARYLLPQPRLGGDRAPQPFAQLLLGGGHAGGGIAGAGDASNAFVSRIGGGIDVPVSSRIAIRVIQADYYLTNFANTVNDHQNNLLLSAGVIFHWSYTK
jgi:outer membrane immunogenic protein